MGRAQGGKGGSSPAGSSSARRACKPDSVPGLPPLDDHSSGPWIAPGPQAADPDLLGQKRPRRVRGARSLFGIAPGGACRAVPVARSAVGSYPTVSPLPCMQGGLISVALSVGLPRPGVTRHRCFWESGLSSKLPPRPSGPPRALGFSGLCGGASMVWEERQGLAGPPGGIFF